MSDDERETLAEMWARWHFAPGLFAEVALADGFTADEIEKFIAEAQPQ